MCPVEVPAQGRTRMTRRQHGAVTAEMAMALPVLTLLLMIGMWAIGVVVANIRCVDAARDVARAAARGEPPEAVAAIGERSAPAGANVDINRHGPDVVVLVSADVRLDWPVLGALPPVRVKGMATIQTEPALEVQP